MFHVLQTAGEGQADLCACLKTDKMYPRRNDRAKAAGREVMEKAAVEAGPAIVAAAQR